MDIAEEEGQYNNDVDVEKENAVDSETSEKEEFQETSEAKENEPINDVDVEKELEKLKGSLDKGLIEQDDYNSKKNELLDL